MGIYFDKSPIFDKRGEWIAKWSGKECDGGILRVFCDVHTYLAEELMEEFPDNKWYNGDIFKLDGRQVLFGYIAIAYDT